MNNRDLVEAALVGTATFLSKLIVNTLKWLGILLAVSIGFFVAIIAGVLKRK